MTQTSHKIVYKCIPPCILKICTVYKKSLYGMAVWSNKYCILMGLIAIL